MGDYSLVVLDFETTGLSPDSGDRVIEAGAVLIEGGAITARFQSLANPGRRVSRFIEEYTGITNAMLAGAPPVAEVMEAFFRFIDGRFLAAHNAAFDSRFLDAELARLGKRREMPFACTLLASRRVYPGLPVHNLPFLAKHMSLSSGGPHHRALADAEMAADLWRRMVADVKAEFGFSRVSFELMAGLARIKKSEAAKYLRREAGGEGEAGAIRRRGAG